MDANSGAAWGGLAFALVVMVGAGAVLEYVRRFETILNLDRYGPTMCDRATGPLGFWLNVAGWSLLFLMGLAGSAYIGATLRGWIASS